MKIVDANIILRYLLNDNEKLSSQAIDIIDNSEVYTTTEVLAEVVYVLVKFYKLPKNIVIEKLLLLFEKNIVLHLETDMIIKALTLYLNNNIDFVDCVLISHSHINHYEIISFDKKVNKLKKTF